MKYQPDINKNLNELISNVLSKAKDIESVSLPLLLGQDYDSLDYVEYFVTALI